MKNFLILALAAAAVASAQVGFDLRLRLHDFGVGLFALAAYTPIAVTIVGMSNPKQLADYRSGKDKLFGFFVGQVMRASQGQANPKVVNDILKQKL